MSISRRERSPTMAPMARSILKPIRPWRSIDEWEATLHPISWEKYFVPILYCGPAFEAFDDFSDFVESISCETSKTCQDRGSNPCRGAKYFSVRTAKRQVDGFCEPKGASQ